MPNLALQLADKTASVGVKAVYGEPIDLDGVTLVPVALSSYGFGGGSDVPDTEGSDDFAGGGGAGGFSVPIGAYVRSGDGVRFEPNLISLLAVGIPFLWVAGHALSRVIRALKRRR